jgi:hypothetical protein
MTDHELVAALSEIGIAPESWRAVALLPVVQVAWADGEVQAPERKRILELATSYGLLDGPAADVVRGWLADRPDERTLALGRQALVALVHRHRGPGSELGPEALADVARHCEEVARAAGGLFDIVFTVDAREREAIAQVVRALQAEADAMLEDLPSPVTGSFRDL